MELFKGRTLEVGQKVMVYVNLNRLGWFSIKDVKTQMVVAHATTVTLADCTFKVSAAGKSRAIRNGQRNVHAVVMGTFIATDLILEAPSECIANSRPFDEEIEVFFNECTGEYVYDTHIAHCQNKRVFCYDSLDLVGRGA